jgi:DNA-directed RNA polymerase specialized sigma24 family protein
MRNQMHSATDDPFSQMMTHLDAVFQTALAVTASRNEAEAAVRHVYAAAKSASRVELFKVLLKFIHRRKLLGADETAWAVIVLIDGQDFSYGDVAQMLGVSREEVAEYAVRGRNQFALKDPACSGGVKV